MDVSYIFVLTGALLLDIKNVFATFNYNIRVH